jgi:carbon storage regulator
MPGSAGLEVGPRATFQKASKKEDAMLVLSRKLNERIVIDGGIVVTVVKIDRNQVRLGIEAPPQVRVFREEIAGQKFQSAPGEVVGAGV